MWQSHIHSQPPNAPLFFGEFASDPALFTEEKLNGFDAWLGPGTLLTVPALYEGELSRPVYFPKAHEKDQSLYFDLHAPYNAHKAGSTATISTPLEHIGLFAREGAVIPVGKPKATVTQRDGPARRHTDGVDVVLEEDGGVVALDDWRGVKIFPGETGEYVGEWIEDDGISADPAKSVIEVTYTATEKQVQVSAKWKEHGFKPLWGKTVDVILPVKDTRAVKGAKEVVYGDRQAWRVEIS
jgi:alpha-glucosidase (family GH31 glycosyl hydrolase)